MYVELKATKLIIHLLSVVKLICKLEGRITDLLPAVDSKNIGRGGGGEQETINHQLKLSWKWEDLLSLLPGFCF